MYKQPVRKLFPLIDQSGKILLTKTVDGKVLISLASLWLVLSQIANISVSALQILLNKMSGIIIKLLPTTSTTA